MSVPTPRLVLGREPAAWTSLVSAILVLLTTFGFNIPPRLRACSWPRSTRCSVCSW
ncbi:hypothetical protein SAMN04488548_1126 [Gordonia westfalica]|uniref:Uncharacterized protein n=1 Tax=Gordonia westfalica TaxID=158898 RepID=A0A1H2DPT9_9ACTN|nr:hypothetical protein SAMN04488548_1126 [Gordonia westfalica]